MKKMLFLRPPTWNMGERAKKNNIIYGTVPYGILSIMSYINYHKKSDIELEILDLNTGNWSHLHEAFFNEELSLYIKTNNFDIVGLSVMYNHMYKYLDKLSTIVKNSSPSTLVIAGGACVTAYYEKILQESLNIDAICYSEGELPVLHLLESDNLSYTLNNHPSFITRDTRNLPSPTFIENLDEIPIIDYSLIDLSKYSHHFGIMKPEKIKNENWLPILTTRGCPYNCYFCTSATLSGKKVRVSSASKVIRDITMLKEKYKINTISFDDDQFLYNKQRAKEILKGIANLNLNVFITAGLTVSLIDDEIPKLLKNAGVKILTFPIESGSEYVLHKIIHKPIKLDNVSKIIDSVKKEGILCHANIIIGFPRELQEHRQESVDFIKNSGVDWCFTFCATALKGSDLYNDCKENGYISDNDFSFDGYTSSSINTPDFTSEEITKKAYLMNLELNFVNNNNMARGDYKTATLYFQHICEKYPDHAFSWYYLSKCCEHNESIAALVESNKYMSNFEEIIHRSQEWEDYAKYFGLIK